MAVAEKSVLRVPDLLDWLAPAPTLTWERGTRGLASRDCLPPAQAEQSQGQKLGPGPGLDLSEVRGIAGRRAQAKLKTDINLVFCARWRRCGQSWGRTARRSPGCWWCLVRSTAATAPCCAAWRGSRTTGSTTLLYSPSGDSLPKPGKLSTPHYCWGNNLSPLQTSLSQS